jgi:hypothetical protein
MTCPRCGLPFVEGRICSLKTSKGEEVCCEQERVRVWKVKPEQVLECARFAYPNTGWILDSGIVFNQSSGPDTLEYFSLSDWRDQQALQIKLREKGWKFTPTKHGFKAVKYTRVDIGQVNHEERADTLEELLVKVVGWVNGR